MVMLLVLFKINFKHIAQISRCIVAAFLENDDKTPNISRTYDFEIS